uniref:Secreted protein n=1 Tax=Meloidogyne incognita TaxID=6306 RepID=A0A914N231_MELIC
MAYASHYLLHHALLSVVGCNTVVHEHEDLCISYKKDVDLNLKQMVVVVVAAVLRVKGIPVGVFVLDWHKLCDCNEHKFFAFGKLM